MLKPSEANNYLAQQFAANFGAISTLRRFDLNVWSEGGEWPLLDKIIHIANSPTAQNFSWPDNCVPARDPQRAVSLVENALANANVYGLSLPCGSGKSTTLMTALARKLSYTTVINVQPSAVSAEQLARHLTITTRDVIVTRRFDRTVKSLVYLSAGEFLAVLHNSLDLGNALIVIDESHSINPVYKALEKILSYVRNDILCTTASNNSNLRSRDGVTIYSAEQFDSDFNDNVSKCMKDINSDTVVVGCSPGIPVHNAANHLVGLTMDVQRVVDYATRLDPTYDDGALVLTYRKASVTEITQMLGRLARAPGRIGKFYYVKTPGEFLYHAKPKLYSRIYDALISAFGLGIESNISTIKSTLSCSLSPVISMAKSSVSSANERNSTSSSRKAPVSTKCSSSSSVSSVRPCRDDETQRVRRTSSGYTVDYVPNDPFKRFFSTRASTWTANPPSCQLTTYDRQNSLLQHMSSEIRSNPTVSTSHEPELPPAQPLHTTEMSHANDIISGKIMPTYQPDELNLIQRAWHMYLTANPSRYVHSGSPIEHGIHKYFAAYKRMREIYKSG